MQESNELSSTTSDTAVTTSGTTDAPAVVATSTSTEQSAPVVAEVLPAAVTETTTVAAETATTIANSTAAAVVKKSWCTPVVKQYGIAFLIVMLMGLALWYMLEEQGRVHTGVFKNIKSLVMPEPIAVLVNGEKVPLSLYEKNYSQLVSQAGAQGMDAADTTVAEQIKQQTIDVLVNSALLRQAAVAAGIEVTEADINTRYQTIVESQGGEEGLTARMAELNITKESLMADIHDEILIQTHLNKAVDTSAITVTTEEVEALYKSVSSNPAIDVPPLEEVRPQIEQEIRFGKEQELIGAYIETLKKDATIEVRI